MDDSGLSTQCTDAFEWFELNIGLGPGEIPWLSAQSSAGFVHGVPRTSSNLPTLDELLDLVYDYTDAVAFAEAAPGIEISGHLHELVFGDPLVLQLFQATRGVAADRGKQLMVRILASPHLATLPWELLPDPLAPSVPRRYMALAPDVQIVRQARGRTYSSRLRELQTPINVLVVLSSPRFGEDEEGRYEFDVFEAKRTLMNELMPLVRDGLIEVDVEERPSVEQLRRRIASRPRGYHVIHYVGHALPEHLILEDGLGRAQRVDSARLVSILRLCPDLRLTVLSGCQTARPKDDPAGLSKASATGWRDLLSLADRCVQAASPAVIGMQAVLPLPTERVLSRYLYQGLASGYSVADALRLARNAVHGDSHRGAELLDWSVPVLFVGGADPGRLLPPGAKGLPKLRRPPVELRLGIQSGPDRFLARDLALRQVVDVITGKTPEHVALITGPAGVGKTSMIERALEEAGDRIDLVLFMHSAIIAPVIDNFCARIDTARGPDVAPVLALQPDGPVLELAERLNELLAQAELALARSQLSPAQWLERLVDVAARRQTVVALDEMGQISVVENALQRALIALLLDGWLQSHPNASDRNGLTQSLELLASRIELALEQMAAGRAHGDEELIDSIRSAAAASPALKQLPVARVGDLLLQVLTDAVSIRETGAQQACGLAEYRQRLQTSATRLAGSTDLARVEAALQRVGAVREAMADAVGALTRRRAGIRLVMSSLDRLPGWIADQDAAFELRLAPLTWGDTWRWIRRNLAGLLVFGEHALSRAWTQLGPRADLWADFEQRVLNWPSEQPLVLAEVLKAMPTPKRVSVAPAVAQRWRRGQRPLRIAIAGADYVMLSDPLAGALTQVAAEQGIAGRVVEGAVAEGALATLLSPRLQFSKGRTSAAQICHWLEQVHDLRPDIVLLDYGRHVAPDDVRDFQKQDREALLLRTMRHESLLIAAGGNEGPRASHTVIPGAYDFVLQVGPAHRRGRIRDIATRTDKLGKPDVYMEDNLSGTPLAAVRRPFENQRGLRANRIDSDTARLEAGRAGEEEPWGSSFAALHALAAAVLAWSLLPSFTPHALRNLLVQSANNAFEDRHCFLTIPMAVRAARRELVRGALRPGPCSISTLSALTAMDAKSVSETVADMKDDIQAISNGRLVLYCLKESSAG